MEPDIRIENDGGVFRIFGDATGFALHELRETVDDIADEFEREASRQAPLGPTGDLKAHPVERSETFSAITTANPLFGGGFAIRGPRGFIKGVGVTPGDVVARVEFTLPENPAHARWVHEGTGIFGPLKLPIVPKRAKFMVFEINGRIFRKKSVRGQEPQPYMENAYEVVNRSFVPARIELLKAKLSLI